MTRPMADTLLPVYRTKSEVIHAGYCQHANSKHAVRWRWAEAEGTVFSWEDGHPKRVENHGRLTVRCMWARACQVCRPDLGVSDA